MARARQTQLARAASSIAAHSAGDLDGAVHLARQAEQIPAGIPGSVARWCSSILTMVLTEAGDLATAGRICAEALARSRDATCGTCRAC
jgi:hypothetical protein